MKIRVLIESAIFALLVYTGYFLWAIVSGYLLTSYYVPDIINANAPVGEMEEKVSFGSTVRVNSVYLVLGFVLLSACYYVVRIAITGLLKRRKFNGRS
jgi:hypothetical protein